MAGLGRKVFTAGEVLTAANVQDYLQDQAVMVFAGSAARGSAIGTATEGMVSYLTDNNLKQLAIEYDMTDIRSTKEGEHQTGYMKRKNKLTDKQFAEATDAIQANNQRQTRPGDSVIWGGGGNINMKSVMGGQFKSVAGESVGINPKAAGDLQGPRASVVMNDHENLQVRK